MALTRFFFCFLFCFAARGPGSPPRTKCTTAIPSTGHRPCRPSCPTTSRTGVNVVCHAVRDGLLGWPYPYDDRGSTWDLINAGRREGGRRC